MGHSYGAIEYSFDNQSKTFTAVRYCTIDNHKDFETVNAVYVKDIDANCTEAEKGHYEATFTNSDFKPQQTSRGSEIVGVPSHNFVSTSYVWNGSSCTATRVCSVDSQHIETETATAVFVKDTDATCTTAETGHYEANFVNSGFLTQSTARDSVTNGTVLGHSYGATQYIWDGSMCEASRTCTRAGCTHNESEQSIGTYVMDTEATCTAAHSGHYKATFKNTVFEAQQTAKDSVTNGEPRGHIYDVQNTTAQYLKEAANCQHASIYWYSCSCGETGTTTFTFGEIGSHDYEDGICKVCSAKKISEGLTYTLNSDGNSYAVAMGICTDSNVIIPDTYNGLPVTTIAQKGFQQKSVITSIVLPNTLTTILDYAFDNCSYLETITIPNSVTSIGEYAFNYCEENSKLTTIGKHAFSYSSLRTITLPNSVTSLGKSVFYNCSNLQSVVWETEITEIPEYTFYHCYNLNFQIPEQITTIGRDAFYYCTAMENVTIPAGVTSIGSYAFSNSGVKTVIMNNTMTALGNIFYDAKSLVSVQLPSGLTTFDSTFFGCSALESIELPTTVQKIDSDTFYGCSALTSVVLPSGVTYIGTRAFQNCTTLANITLSENLTSIQDNAFYCCTALSNITLPSGLQTIGGKVFYGCKALTNITIPASVVKIGANAFEGCTNLTSITFEYASWGVSKSYTGSNLIIVDVSNATTNAANFKNTYKNYHWIKQD